MTVYVFMAALALCAAALMTRPWWRRGADLHMQRRAANVTAYKMRVIEIDNDLANGLIDPESAAELKEELGARLLTDAQPESAPAPVRSSRLPALLAALALAVFAGVWYWAGASWRTDQLIEMARKDPSQAQSLAIEAMVSKLAAKLEKNPEDAEGWAMLGRSYYVMQHYGESAQAYGKANALLSPGNPDLLADQAESLALANERNLQGKPVELLEAALKIEPGNIKSLWYSGIAAMQRDDRDAAKKYWTRLGEQKLPDDLRVALDEQLQALGVAVPKPAAQTAAATGLALKVQVEIAPALASKLNGQQTLFVFAKAESGPPMPLAVQRFTAPKLPMELTLDDSMAMMPALKLSGFDHWVVTARLTRGGTVQAESGDLQGQVKVTKADAGKPVHVLIDQIVP